MKPHFALSLSHDGIVLLHLVEDGGTVLGTAIPAAPDLDAALEQLVETMRAMSPEGFCTKLILPDDQVRYEAIASTAAAPEERRAAAAAALEAATPYASSDLAFDVRSVGATLYIAATARDTLTEAEAFALQHGFQPVCVVAKPDDPAYGEEVFLGETRCAADILASLKKTEPAETPEPKAPEVVSAVPPAPPPLIEVPASTEAVEKETVSFVSRRRVPTFRTPQPDVSGATEGAVPGFGEAKASFARQKRDKPKASPSRAKSKPAAPLPAPSAVVTSPSDEAERLTVFGAREDYGVAKKLNWGGAAAAVAVLVVGGLAAFASGPIGNSMQGMIAKLAAPQPVVQFTTPPTPVEPPPQLVAEEPEAQVTLAALEEGLSDEDAAVLDALRAPALSAPEAETTSPEKTEDDLRASYAVTGVWPQAPDVPEPPAQIELENLYLTSIDPVNPNFDAVALPAPDTPERDVAFFAPSAPAPIGTVFDLDARGLVRATPGGTLNPDGVFVYSGPPPAKQPRSLVKLEDPGEDIAMRIRLAALRPQVRPGNLIENAERAALSGLTRSELAELRPRMRPQSAQEDALANASLVRLDTETGNVLIPAPDNTGVDTATAQAVAVSLRPDTRPGKFKDIIARSQPVAATRALASTASVAPKTVKPRIPSSASAARAATVKNAINLNKVNLIGVYGKPSSRRALVRLENGRYRKVEVGDRIDGGRVSAIGDSELRYQKSGRAIILKMPRS
ncbi:MAG: hypothetical protein AAF665_15870 [Pseudomonadota bacterium]